MLLEGTEASFERMEHRLRQLCRLAGVKHVLEHYALAKDMALQFGDVPVGLGKMLLFLGTIHGFAPAGRRSPRAFPFLCIGAIRAASIEAPTQVLVEANGYGEAAVSFRCSSSAIDSGFAITLALTTLPPLSVRTTARSEAFGSITNSPALAAPISLPPLIVKTRTLSEAFGVITISPALAAPTVTSSAATMAANDFISGLSIKF
jgi:hypothetical protein